LKKVFKKIGIGVGALIALVIVFMLVLTIYHRISLGTEQKHIEPNGHIVKVNGHDMHVYLEGENATAPVLVFLAGHGTPAPVYDFKPLYSLLSGEYRIAVVDKAGYGYSEIADVPRDIDTILSETRMALSLVDETGPYVLFPHSISGLEAIRWSQVYPEEVAGIIGIDMAVPSYYIEMEDFFSSQVGIMKILNILARTGIQRFSFIAPVSNLALTEDEYTQARLLAYRNQLNHTMLAEGELLFDNVWTVEQAGIPSVPNLQLVSTEQPEVWISHHIEFAKQSEGLIELLDAGHYLHQDEPERIAALSREFIMSISG